MAKSSGGLSGIAEEAKSLAADLGAPIAMLAAGASKVSVAWMAFSNIWMRKVLGPMADFTGIAAGAISAVRRMAAAFKDFGMSTAASMESATVRFKPFLKGIESARARIEELAKTAASTPFSMEEVTAASAQLQNLTKGALATGKQLEMVGDVAAMTGRGFEDTAYWVGRLYDAIMSGRPIGEATMRLQEMGAVSGSTRNQLESLTESGASSAEVWKVAEKEFSRANGSMKDMSNTLEGLQSTLKDNESIMGAAFAKGYMSGEKAMVEATAHAYEKLTPVVESFGDAMGQASNVWQKSKAGVINYVTGIEALAPVLKFAGASVGVFLAAIQAASGVAILKWLSGVATGVKGATSASTTASGAFRSLGQAMIELVSGNAAAAKGLAVTAAQSLRAAGAGGILRSVLLRIGSAFKFVGAAALATARALIANPLFVLAAAVVGVAVALKTMNDRFAAARKAVTDFNQATREQINLLKQSFNSIRSASDMAAFYAEASRKLAEARLDLAAAESAEARESTKSSQMMTDGAHARIEAAKKLLAMTDRIKASDLAPTEGTELAGDKLAREKRVEEVQFNASLDGMNADERATALRARAQALRERATGADIREKDKNEQRVRVARGQYGLGGRQDLLGQRAAAELSLKAAKEHLDELRTQQTLASLHGMGSGPGMDAVMRARATVDERQGLLANINGQIKAEDPASAIRDALASSDEVAQLQAKISLLEAYSAVEQEIVKNETQINDLRAKRLGTKKAEYTAISREIDARKQDNVIQKDHLTTMESMMELAGLDPAKRGAAIANMTSTRDVLIAREKEDRDRAGDSEIEAVRAEREARILEADALLATERATVDVMEEGLAKQAAYLDLESRRVDNAKEFGQLTEAQEEAERSLIETQKELLQRDQSYRDSFARLDIDAAALDLMDEGLARQIQLIDLERERLQIKIQQSGASEKEAAAERAKLDASEAAARKQANLLQKQAALQTAADRSQLAFQRAMLSGRYGDAYMAKKRQEAAEDAMRSNQLKEQARQMFADPAQQQAYHDQQMANARADRERDEAAERTMSRKQEQIRSMQRTAELLDATGKSGAAERLRKRAGKLEDAEFLRSRSMELEGEGRSPAEAARVARNEMLLNRAERALSEGGTDGSYTRGASVADSMQRIGGGGGFYGTPDASVPQKLDKVSALLSQIRDNTGGGGHQPYFAD